MARERCKDLIGKKVQLLRDVQTMGGHFFEKGRTMLITSTYRGRYGLRALGTDPDQTNVKNVSDRSFVVLPEDELSPREPDCEWTTRNPVGTPVEVHVEGEWLLGSVDGYAPGRLRVQLYRGEGEPFANFGADDESRVRFLNYESGMRKAFEIAHRELGSRVFIDQDDWDAVEEEIDNEVTRLKGK